MNKKIFKLLFFCCLMMLILTACDSNKVLTYDVETGDEIKIELKTTDGYDMTADNPIKISKNGAKVSDGIFITLETFDKYENIIKNDINSTIIESGDRNGVKYIFYNYNDKEYNYLMKINDSNTGFILATPNSQEIAEESFSVLNFSK